MYLCSSMDIALHSDAWICSSSGLAIIMINCRRDFGQKRKRISAKEMAYGRHWLLLVVASPYIMFWMWNRMHPSDWLGRIASTVKRHTLYVCTYVADLMFWRGSPSTVHLMTRLDALQWSFEAIKEKISERSRVWNPFITRLTAIHRELLESGIKLRSSFM